MTDEAPSSCEFCDYEGVILKRYPVHRDFPHRFDVKWLCEICTSTRGGNALEYPEQYKESKEAMRMIGYVGNMLLAEIRALKEKP